MSERPISAMIFAMYDCEDCARRFAVEDDGDEPEVRCPACGSVGVDYVDHGRVTPVEWVLDCLEKREEVGAWHGAVICRGMDGPTKEANARYIATFDPPTVLAMLDEIERLRRIEKAAKRVAVMRQYDHRRVAGLCDCSLCGLNAALDGGKAGDAK